MIKAWDSVSLKEEELGEDLKYKLFILSLRVAAFPLQRAGSQKILLGSQEDASTSPSVAGLAI